ncbi:unnamed protein product, partial [marine sediment metagenome]
MSTSLSDPGNWRLTTGTGIPAKILERRGSFTEEAADAQEVYIIKADRLTQFILESFPEPLQLFGTVFYPDRRRMPGAPELHTKRVSWEALVDGVPVDPFGTDPTAESGTYKDDIKVTIDYGTSSSNGASSSTTDPLTFLEVSAVASGNWEYPPARGDTTWEGIGSEPDLKVQSKDTPMPMVVPEV